MRRIDMALIWKLIEPPGAMDPSVRGNWTIAYPGIVLAQTERDGVCHLMDLPVGEAEMLLAKTAAEVVSDDEEEYALVAADEEEEEDALGASEDEEDPLSNSEESLSGLRFWDDDAWAELESDAGEPFQLQLRRVLQETMPERVFATLERVVSIFS